MKKKLALLLTTIILITIAFISCNLESSTGILWKVAQSKEPLSIRYKQLLGDDGTNLYFRTADGVVGVTTAKVKTTVIAGKNKNLIQAASLLSAQNKVFYYTNNTAERAANQIRYVDTTNLSAVPGTITVEPADTTSSLSDLSIKGLYANSMILVAGKSGATKIYELLLYDTVTDTFKKTTYGEFTSITAGYDIESVIQQTSKEQDATEPMIVSFINESGDREHYLVNPTGAIQKSLGTENVQVANFLYNDVNNMYILTTNGKIYHVDSDVPTWTSIASSSKTYATNAFALAVDYDGTNYHLITKPSAKSSALHVFSFPKALPNAAIGAGVDVKSGYAQELALATIVSSQVKSTDGTTSTDLLIATDEDGMYDIFIKHPDANKDISTNGSSSEGEGYSFP